MRSFAVAVELHAIDLSGDRKNFIAGSGDGKIAAINLADVEIQVSELSLEHYQLTKIRGTDTLFVSTGAEPKIRIIDEAVIMAKGEFVIEGQGHKMVALP